MASINLTNRRSGLWFPAFNHEIVKEPVTLTSLDWIYAVAATLPALLWMGIIRRKKPRKSSRRHQVRHCSDGETDQIRTRRKPAWVTDELIRLKAHLPEAGCRTLSLTFNRLFAHRGGSVGKTFVAQTIQKHRYEIHMLRRKIKNRPAYDVPKGKYWGIDLTQVADTRKHPHTIFGVCEHHSRLAITLKRLPNKASLTLLRCLLDAIEQFGKPRIIRTDNEAVFTSRLFRFGLWLLGIRHQTTDTHCPWQNGRIERFFGTFKAKVRQIVIEDAAQLDEQLATFRWWYNQVRPHQNLGGRTPAEAWLGKHPPRARHWYRVSLWNGVLNGFHPRE